MPYPENSDKFQKFLGMLTYLGKFIPNLSHSIAYTSRALTTYQQNYAQIKKEMLAMAFVCTRFDKYIYGMPTIKVESVHKHLEAIFKKPLHQAPVWLQKMIMSIQKYTINLVYCPGKQLAITDILSRAYLSEQLDNSTAFKFVVNVISAMLISNSKLEQRQMMTQSDSALQQLM